MDARELNLADVPVVLPGAIIIVDAAGRVTDADEAGWKVLGGTSAKDQMLSAIVAEPDDKVERYLSMCRRNLQAVPGRISIRGVDKEDGTFAVRGAAMRARNTGDVCLYVEQAISSTASRRFTTLNQTVDRLRLEIKARRHMEAILEAEKQTLASVFQGLELNAALQILATAVEEHSEGMLVSILLVEDGVLRHAVAPSLAQAYVEAIDGVAIGPDIGSCGTAAHTGEIVIASDIENDPRWADFKAAALAADLRACWSSPIISSDQTVLGTFALYFRTPREPAHEELRLIANSAYVAGVAIERFRSQHMLRDLLHREQRGREDAESENRAKDEFLAMLGHELRNPLAGITNAALALDARDGAAHFLQIILNESRLLKRILDDLLDISRLSRGKLKLQVEQINLDVFAEDLVNSVHAMYPTRDIGFLINQHLGFVMADPSRLRQSILNLVDNAVKYSQADDEISVSVQTEQDCVEIRVTDTGQGIDADILGTIFEPFVQSDGSIARTNSGLGLGLALVKRFAVMHGGDVSVVSNGVGQGSQFIFSIPRQYLAATQSDSFSSSVGEAAAGRKKVLVVEDNENAREGLCELLKLWGHDVAAAADGQQALDILQQSSPDVALVDIGLPLLDGYAVAKTVRADPALAETTLVALTGYGQDSDRERAIEAGFDVHIVKPADLQDLIEIFGVPGETLLSGK